MVGLSCGVVGLPNVGKSTLFNALVRGQVAAAANYPFCTIEPNVGIVNVQDPRLAVLQGIGKSAKIIYATTTFVDIAGIVKGASAGEGLGNKFLSHIREVDVIVHVVRCFSKDEVVHVEGSVDPIRDIEVINLELALADLQMVDNMLQKKRLKEKEEIAVLEKVRAHLNLGKPVRSLPLRAEEKLALGHTQFLTDKKVIYVANVGEEDLPSMENPFVEKVRLFAEEEGSQSIAICAKLEEEISQLEPLDAKALLQEMGLSESGLDRLTKLAFHTLGLITFLTTGEIETRAWTIVKGTPAQEAAGKIHTDIQKGFIRAEVVTYDDMVKYGGRAKAKEAGRVRFEGKEYVIQDGDVIIFMHN